MTQNDGPERTGLLSNFCQSFNTSVCLDCFAKTQSVGELMTTCFEGVAMQPVFWAAASVSAVAAVVMVCMLKYQHFHGKRFYGLTFFDML